MHQAYAEHVAGVPFDVQLRMRTKQGEYRWFHLRGSAEFNDQPAFQGSAPRSDGTARIGRPFAIDRGDRRSWRILAHAPVQHKFRVARDRLGIPSQLGWEEQAGRSFHFLHGTTVDRDAY